MTFWIFNYWTVKDCPPRADNNENESFLDPSIPVIFYFKYLNKQEAKSSTFLPEYFSIKKSSNQTLTVCPYKRDLKKVVDTAEICICEHLLCANFCFKLQSESGNTETFNQINPGTHI